MNRVKRLTDLVFVLLAGAPLLVLTSITALIVLLTMGRPVFFRQRRLGLNEEEFDLLKFRTMTNARDGTGQLLPDRDRISPVGNLLRKLSLDELPQFLNVVRGEMSIIGPRPLYPAYLPYYRDRERKRHWVRPGITGLAQVSGRNTLYWNDRLAADANYVEAVSPGLDLAIFGRTIQKVLGGSGVSTIANDSGERLDTLRSYPTSGDFAIRRFEFSDIPKRVKLFHDPRIRQHMTLPADVTEESTANWLRTSRKNPARRDFVLYNLHSDEVVAMLGIHDRAEAPGVPEMYILVDPEQQGQGIGRKALSLLLEWMRSLEKYIGCWLSVSTSNEPAIALYKRLGFEITGVDALSDAKRIEMTLIWGESS